MDTLLRDLLVTLGQKGQAASILVGLIVFAFVAVPYATRLSREFLSPRHRLELAKLKLDLLNQYRQAANIQDPDVLARLAADAKAILDDARVLPTPIPTGQKRELLRAIRTYALQSLGRVLAFAVGFALAAIPLWFIGSRNAGFGWVLLWIWFANGLADFLWNTEYRSRNVYTIYFGLGAFVVVLFVVLAGILNIIA